MSGFPPRSVKGPPRDRSGFSSTGTTMSTCGAETSSSSTNRRIVPLDRSVRTGGWGSLGLGMRMMRLRGKTLGVVGFGRIGRAVCTKALAFGFEVLTSDPYLSADVAQEHGARMVDMPSLLRASDFVTLHSPLTPETTNLIGQGKAPNLNLTQEVHATVNANGVIPVNVVHSRLSCH